jgi:hypothetical protein
MANAIGTQVTQAEVVEEVSVERSAYNPTMTIAELNSLIEKVGKSAKDFTEESHLAAFGCIEQIYKHNNATPARNLYNALKDAKGVRHTSFRQWIVNNTNFVWKPEEKVFKLDKSKNKEIDLSYCMDHPYYEKEETVITTVSAADLQKSVHSIVQKYEKKIKEGKVKGNIIELSTYLESLKALDRLAS